MGIIGGMNVIDVITFGTQLVQNQRHVHQRLVNLLTGTRRELDERGYTKIYFP